MTHKEFYFWLEGYLHEKKISSYDEAATFLLVIKEKMNQVKDIQNELIKITPFERIPMPVNPLPKNDDPYKPPYEVYCGNKTQLND
jgi:hypothetical protein